MSSGPVANRIGRSNSNAFIGGFVSSKSDHVGHMLVGGMFIGVRAFPACQVPDFKTAAAADEGDLAFQVKLLAKIVRQEKPALFVGRAMLGLGMKLPQIDAQIARRNAREHFPPRH